MDPSLLITPYLSVITILRSSLKGARRKFVSVGVSSTSRTSHQIVFEHRRIRVCLITPASTYYSCSASVESGGIFKSSEHFSQ